jgi:transposase-like protein
MVKKRKEALRLNSGNKVKIIKEHLINKRTVSEICDEYKISPAVFYRWQNDFFERGHVVFDSSETKKQDSREGELLSEIKELRNKLTVQNSVMLELMEEHVKVKKNFGMS